MFTKLERHKKADLAPLGGLADETGRTQPSDGQAGRAADPLSCIQDLRNPSSLGFIVSRLSCSSWEHNTDLE